VAIIGDVKSAAILAISVFALAGCANRNVDSLEAVKQGVIRDLSKTNNINMGAMDVSVVSVSFRDKEADAVVSFAPKGGTAAQGLTMSYTMERQGSEWHIKGRAASDLQKHAAQAPGAGAQGGAMAPGMEGHGSGAQMPAGHPGMMGGAGAADENGKSNGAPLPAGHPQLDK